MGAPASCVVPLSLHAHWFAAWALQLAVVFLCGGRHSYCRPRYRTVVWILSTINSRANSVPAQCLPCLTSVATSSMEALRHSDVNNKAVQSWYHRTVKLIVGLNGNLLAVNHLVILIRFWDHRNRTLPTPAQISSVLNGGSATLAPTGSVRDYWCVSAPIM
jgi:hypothetical protein